MIIVTSAWFCFGLVLGRDHRGAYVALAPPCGRAYLGLTAAQAAALAHARGAALAWLP